MKLASELARNILDRVTTDEQLPDPALGRRAGDSVAIRSRLPLMFRSASLIELATRVHDKRLMAAAVSWRWGAGNVLLLGPTRIGKSTAAAMLFRATLGRAVRDGGRDWDLADSMRWFGAEELSLARREHPMGRGEAPEVVEACSARLLVLDDAGWDRDPAAVSAVLAARYERGWPTVITSGRTREQLSAHYGAAVVRRMAEAGGQNPVIVDCFGGAPVLAEEPGR